MGPGALFQLGLLSLPQWHPWRANLQLSDSCACPGPLTLLAWIPAGQLASLPDLSLHCHHGLAWQPLSCVWHRSTPPDQIMFCGLTPCLPSDLSLLQTDMMNLESWLNLGTTLSLPCRDTVGLGSGWQGPALLAMTLALMTGLKTTPAVLNCVFPLAAHTMCLREKIMPFNLSFLGIHKHW